MNRIPSRVAALALVLFASACDDDDLTTFRMTIENVSPQDLLATDRADGTAPLSPGVYVVTEEENAIFEVGEQASVGLERLAEDGIASPDLGGDNVPTTLLDQIQANERALDFGTISSPGGADNGAGLGAGETASFTFQAEQGEELQIAMMFVQSNDWFIAFGGGGLELFDVLGQARSGDVTDQMVLYDAGTEADEAPGQGEFQPLAPSGVNEGPEENVAVQTVVDRQFSFGVPTPAEYVRVTIVAFDEDSEIIP